MVIRVLGLFLLLSMAIRESYAQWPPALEALFETLAEEEADPAQIERWLDLLDAPLDLNTASATELSDLPLLDAATIRAVLALRAQQGGFTALEDLLALETLTPERLAALRPFVRVVPRAVQRAGSPLSGSLTQRVSGRIETSRAYREGQYGGSPYRTTSRLAVRHASGWSGALVLARDPGEPITWNPARRHFGFDAVGGHGMWSGGGRVEQVVLGQFSVHAGEGLAVGQGGMLGKSAETTRAGVRPRTGIRPTAASQPGGAWRGVGLTVRPAAGWAVAAGLSRVYLTATRDTVDGRPVVSSISSAGLHRSASELQRRASLVRDDAVLLITQDHARYTWTFSGVVSRLEAPLVRGSDPSRLFLREDPVAWNAGLSARVFSDWGTVWGELALDPERAVAGVLGVQGRWGRQAEGLLHLRHYPAGFSSRHGQAFGKWSGASNERGVYVGMRVRPHPHWRVSAYLDQYRSPWLRYGISRPVSGRDVLLQGVYTGLAGWEATVQTRQDCAETSAQPGAVRTVGTACRSAVRLEARYEHSATLQVRTRYESVRVRQSLGDAQSGSGMLADVRWQVLRTLRVDGRVALYHTSDYAARLYAYESDVLRGFSVPALSGYGMRRYVLVRWTPLSRTLIEMRFAESIAQGVDEMGTGWDAHPGNRTRDVTLQATLRW